jgi:tRNA threonylcarbamoyl adenosine modification protein YeaZ
MNWLSIETSSTRVSLALGRAEEVLREIHRQGNASILIEEIYRELNVNLDSIDTFFIGKGPGSYNGLRVGYAFVKGLACLGRGRGVIEIPTALSLAFEASTLLGVKEGSFLVLNNARRGELHAALVVSHGVSDSLKIEKQWIARPDELLIPPVEALVSSDDALDLLVTPVPDSAQKISIFPRASTSAILAIRQKLPPAGSLPQLEPHYVRSAVPETAAAPSAEG